uniref:non-specific serine/threonine protein kinase n=1 Tax=Heterorhabditis bacteriophora TaxID=37862 RepID=A0A1I7WQM0_HETBA
MNTNIANKGLSTRQWLLFREVKIMKQLDHPNIVKLWMNIGYEEDELKPYSEPPKDQIDETRIEKLIQLGFNKVNILDALEKEKFEDIHATYLLLGERKSDMDAGDLALAQQAVTHSTHNVSSGIGALAGGVSSAAQSPSKYSRVTSAQTSGAAVTPSSIAPSAPKQPSRRSSQNDAAVSAPTSAAGRPQVQMRQQPTSRHPAISMVPPSYQTGVDAHREYLTSFNRGGTSSTVSGGTRKSSDPKGRVPINLGVRATGQRSDAPVSARSSHSSNISYQMPTSASLVSKLSPAIGTGPLNLKTPIAMVQVPVPLQISHAPTEPAIKEDEDESSESSGTAMTGANGMSSTQVPIIGGGVATPQVLTTGGEDISTEPKTPLPTTPDKDNNMLSWRHAVDPASVAREVPQNTPDELSASVIHDGQSSLSSSLHHSNNNTPKRDRATTDSTRSSANLSPYFKRTMSFRMVNGEDEESESEQTPAGQSIGNGQKGGFFLSKLSKLTRRPSVVTSHQYSMGGGPTGLPPPYIATRRGAPIAEGVMTSPHNPCRAGTIGPIAGNTGPMANALAQIREGQPPSSPQPITGREEEIKPRSLRFTWSMKTTSSLAPDEMMRSVNYRD